MIFMDCYENASSRLRRPQSYEICENSKALGTCQAKKNSPRGCGGVGAFYGLIFAGSVCTPFGHSSRRRSSVAREHSGAVQMHLLPMSSFLHGEVKRGAGCMTWIWSDYVHCAMHKTMCGCIAHIAQDVHYNTGCQKECLFVGANLSTYSSSSS